MQHRAPTMLAILDFEATCADAADTDWSTSKQEIIEFPVALVSANDGSAIDTFSTFVRPVHQPVLTAFCTKLTTIRQEEVDGAPDISDVLTRFQSWLAQHGADDNNTCVVTCGDWDLRRMWPQQASLVPGLRTPPLFRSWANIKTVFHAHTGIKPSGMMSMLNHFSLEHQGIHHRGIDDVENLSRLVVRLLSDRAVIAATWSATERHAERHHHEMKWNEARQRLEHKALARSRMPSTVAATVTAAHDSSIAQQRSEVERLRRLVEVFDPAAGDHTGS
jgi:ERI1 exoribonuclease 3